MKLLKVNPYALAGFLIVIAAVVCSFSMGNRPTKENAATLINSRSVPRPDAQRRVPPTVLQPADVATMTAQDWKDRFEKSPSEVSSEYEQEILALADELAEVMKKNPDPNASEAMVFSDAILTLLAEGHRPE